MEGERSRNIYHYLTKSERDLEEVKSLEKYYPPWPFSTQAWYSQVNENAWEFIRRKFSKVHITVTNRCNFPCKICFSSCVPDDFSMEMSKRRFIEILRKIGRNKRVILTGGEPTARRDILELVDLVRKSGNFPEMYTNGIKLSDFSFAEELVKRGIKRIIFSFDGFNKEYYKIMNGSSEILFYKLLALKNLLKLNLQIVLSSRIVKGLNEEEVKKIIEFCVSARKKGKNIVGITFLGATKYGRFMIENGEVKWQYLYKLIERATNGVANLEYFIEFKKFMLLLHKVGEKFGVIVPFGPGLVGMFKAGSIERIIEVNQLKKINGELERGKYIKALKTLWRLGWSKWFLRKVFGSFRFTFPVEYMMPSRLFFIGLGNINVPAIPASHSLDSIGLFNIKGKPHTFVNYLTYAEW